MDVLPNIEISPPHWAIVAEILRRYIPHKTVLAFGSRARFAAKKPYSDLDLTVVGDEPLSLSLLAALAHDFTESALPFKVDIVDWAAADEAFLRIIRLSGVIVWLAG